jgi:hypothetical protein
MIHPWMIASLYLSIGHYVHTYVCVCVYIYIFFFLDGTGIWTHGLMLARQMVYHLSHSTSPFVLGISEIGSPELFPRILLISASWAARVTGPAHSYISMNSHPTENDPKLQCLSSNPLHSLIITPPVQLGGLARHVVCSQILVNSAVIIINIHVVSNFCSFSVFWDGFTM